MILEFAAAFNRPHVGPSPRESDLRPIRPKSAFLMVALAMSISEAQGLADTTRTYSIDEVTVIETRTGLDPARLPYSATVLPITLNVSTRADALTGALESIPGVFAASRSGGTDLRLSIRGFGARGNGDRSNSGTIRGVKVMLDGVPLTEPDGRTSPDLLTFLLGGRVEVLRTNASALFGNASGGIVNVESMEPTDAMSWSLATSAGSFGLRKGMGRVGLSFDGGRLAVSGGSMTLDGWRQNSSVSAAGLYAVFMARPADGMRVRATLGLTRHRFGIPGALTEAEEAADPTLADPVYLQRRERRDNLVGMSSLQIKHTLGGSHTLSASAFVGPKSLIRSERNTYREFQRWTGGGGLVWRWLPGPSSAVAVGFDGSRQDGGSLFYALVNGERGDSLRTNKSEQAANAGLFIEGSLEFGETWNISAGLRVDRQRYRSSVFPAGTTLSARVEELTFQHATPHLGLAYRIDDGHSAFISMSGGLEVPAFNEVDPPPGIGAADLNPWLKPMTSTTLEAGHRFHGRVFDDWETSTSAAVFVIRVRNEIVPFNNGAWFLSAGRSERVGAEFAATVRSRDGHEAIISWTRMEGTYQAFVSTTGHFTGNVVPGIPDQAFSGKLRLALTENLWVELGGRTVGSMTVDDANTLKIPSSAVAEGSVEWRHSVFGTQVIARFDVRNLFDASYTASAFINPISRANVSSPGSAVSPAYREPGLPRNFILTVSFGS